MSTTAKKGGRYYDMSTVKGLNRHQYQGPQYKLEELSDRYKIDGETLLSVILADPTAPVGHSLAGGTQGDFTVKYYDLHQFEKWWGRVNKGTHQ